MRYRLKSNPSVWLEEEWMKSSNEWEPVPEPANPVPVGMGDPVGWKAKTPKPVLVEDELDEIAALPCGEGDASIAAHAAAELRHLRKALENARESSESLLRKYFICGNPPKPRKFRVKIPVQGHPGVTTIVEAEEVPDEGPCGE
jgi:hypothetical protein